MVLARTVAVGLVLYVVRTGDRAAARLRHASGVTCPDTVRALGLKASMCETGQGRGVFPHGEPWQFVAYTGQS
jgi:hypothetical protein